MKNMKKIICLLMVALTLVSVLALCVFADEPADVLPPTCTEEQETPKMIFEPANFIKNIGYMGVGMLGIFIVIGVIVLCTMALNAIFKERNN